MDKLDLFINQTTKDITYIRDRVDKLWDWRMMMIGGSIVISVICSTMISLIAAYLRLHV